MSAVTSLGIAAMFLLTGIAGYKLGYNRGSANTMRRIEEMAQYLHGFIGRQDVYRVEVVGEAEDEA